MSPQTRSLTDTEIALKRELNRRAAAQGLQARIIAGLRGWDDPALVLDLVERLGAVLADETHPVMIRAELDRQVDEERAGVRP